MHINNEIVVVSNGHDLNELIAWAEKLLQSYHHFKVTMIINSNFEPKINHQLTNKIKVMFYPSNRIIEPQILMIQLIKYFSDETIYLITKPKLFSPMLLPVCQSIFMPIQSQGVCIGMAINQTELLAHKHELLKQINLMRLALNA